MSDDALVCPSCGQPVAGVLNDDHMKSENSSNNQMAATTEVPDISNSVTNKKDTGNFGWAILGFFIPLVGLILFLVWRKDTPRNANSAGIGALVSVVTTIVYWISIALAAGLAR
jgi:hypothetical protein